MPGTHHACCCAPVMYAWPSWGAHTVTPHVFRVDDDCGTYSEITENFPYGIYSGTGPLDWLNFTGYGTPATFWWDKSRITLAAAITAWNAGTIPTITLNGVEYLLCGLGPSIPRFAIPIYAGGGYTQGQLRFGIAVVKRYRRHAADTFNINGQCCDTVTWEYGYGWGCPTPDPGSEVSEQLDDWAVYNSDPDLHNRIHSVVAEAEGVVSVVIPGAYETVAALDAASATWLPHALGGIYVPNGPSCTFTMKRAGASGHCSYVSAGYTNYVCTIPLDYSFQVGGALGVAPVAWSLGATDGALTFQTSNEVLTSTASWGGYTVNPWPDDSGWGPEHNGTTHVTCAPTDIDAGPTSATNPTDQLQGLVFYFHDTA